MIGGLGVPELVVILLIALVLFGAKNIPEIARSLGKSVHAFKKGLKEIQEDINISDSKKQDESEPGEDK